MRNAIQDLFIRIVRAELTGGDCSSFTPNDEVVCLATKHQLAHLIFHAYSKAGEKKYNAALYRNIWMTEQQKAAFNAIRNSFKDYKIPYIPLKGIVIRSLYPEDWMRNSCDIDILVKRENLPVAEDVLLGLGYTKQGKTAHDVSYCAGKVRVELHFALIEEYRYPKVSAVLEKVWQYADQVSEYEFAMRDEILYFYHIAHMMKHFENGGCGVRPFLDLWLLNHKKEFDYQRRVALLQQGGLVKFAHYMEMLSDAWFSNHEASDIEEIETFVFEGEAYGTVENRVDIKQQKRGGTNAYLRSRLFVPYSKLKEQHPVLQKRKFLLPFFEIARWFNVLHRKERYINELKRSVSAGEKKSINEILNKLGL